MGWVNYVKIPELKLLVETSRHLSDVLDEEFNTSINDIVIDLNKKYDELTINDLHSLIKYYDESTKIFREDELLLYWLNHRRINYSVISEFEYCENKDDYEEWCIINKNL